MKDTPFGTIPDEWDLNTINDACSVVTDYVANGSFKSLADNVEYQNQEDTTVLIRLVDYNNGFNGDFVYVNDHAYEFLAKSKLFGDEIIISNVGANVGTVFRCPHLDKQMTLGPNSVMLKFKDCDDFYFYWLKSPAGQHMLQSIVTGSAQPKFNKTNLRQVVVPVPPVEIQKKIANILFAIDKKIENNAQINRNLSEQAKVLCKAYFTDYEPFGGECPNDWEVTPLSSIAEFISGYSYKGNELVDESNIAMATIKNFDRNGGFKIDGYKPIVPSGKLKSTQHAELFDTLVAHTDLTQNADVIGNAELVLSKSGYDDIIFSMDLVKVTPKNNLVSPYILAALLHSDSFKQHCLGYVNGTTVLHLSKKALQDYELPLPSDLNELKPLDETLESMYRQMASIMEENTRLIELRDNLLPKLMSGELDVSDLDL